MKRTKTQRGITLVALIITIIVLMILAVVSINSVRNGGLVKHAQDAAQSFNVAQEKEEQMLSSYLGQLMALEPQIGQVKNQNGELLKVGDYINYNGKKHVVLHNSSTQGLQIVPTELPGKTLQLKGLSDWENRFQKFKVACAEYVNKGLGAIDARVIGTNFDVINSNININTTTMIKEAGGTTRLLKVYGTSDTAAGVDTTNAIALLQTGRVNIGANKVWCSTKYAGTRGLEIYYLDLNTTDYNGLAIMASLSLVSGEANTLAATDLDGVTCQILPIILLDSRIQVTSGDGASADTAYTYTFNG